MATVMITLCVNCGGLQSSTDSNASTADIESSAPAAMASAFGGSDTTSTAHVVSGVKKYLIQKAQKEDAPGVKTCEWMTSGPSDIEVDGDIDAGVYGADFNMIEVSKEQGCTIDGEENPNGEYASFTGESHQLNCQDKDGNEFSVLMEDFSGVYKDTLDEDAIAHTSIYGAFTLTPMQNNDPLDAQAVDVDCSLTIDDAQENGGGNFGGGCTDGTTGEEFEADEDIVCQDAEASEENAEEDSESEDKDYLDVDDLEFDNPNEYDYDPEEDPYGYEDKYEDYK